MASEIVNIYSFNSKLGISYIFSTKKTNDSLGYIYYLLTPNEKEEYIIQEKNNLLRILHGNGINLIKVTKNTPEYETFLVELLSALENKLPPKKGPNRK